MKTLFFGTPALAVPYLELLRQKTEVLAVVTNPDEPAGRGYTLQASPVKQSAVANALPVLQPASVKETAFIQQIKAFNADLAIVVAYGKLLPKALLESTRHGFLNVHFSLLPAYRGAAPIQRALMAGDPQTGVSLFWLDEGMDTGTLFLQKSLSIKDDEDADALRARLIPFGVEALAEILGRIEKNQITRQPQTGAVSLAPPLSKEEGRIDWSKPARHISNLVRGVTPWPGASTLIPLAGKPTLLKILKASPVLSWEGSSASPAGTVVGLAKEEGFVVKCGQEFLKVLHVQPEGKRPMSAWAFWQGARLLIGEILSSR